MPKISVRKLAMLGLLIAMHVVLARFLSITTPIARFSFDFLPLALCGMLFGPGWAALVGATGDFLGTNVIPALSNPAGAAYFPGFTLTQALAGAVYGFLLYKNEKNLVRTLISVGIVCWVLNFVLDSCWLYILMGEGYIVGMLPLRAVKCLIMSPIQVFIIHIMGTKLPLGQLRGRGNA